MSTAEPTPETIESFIAAVKSGDSEALKTLLADPALKANIDSPWFAFDSPAIIQASNRRNREMVELLIENGADINARSTWWAGGFGVLPCGDDDWVEYLIEHGATVDVFAAAGHDKMEILREMVDADPNKVHSKGGDGQTPLHFARSNETCRFLLDHGADIDALDVDHGSTPAQYSIDLSKKVQFLIDHGAANDVFLMIAAGDVEALRNAIAADPEIIHSNTSSGPHNPHPAPGEHIYIYKIGEHATLLHAAAHLNQLEIIDFLIDSGTDVNIVGGYDDSTPLHLAAWNGYIEVAEALLKRGADIERRSGSIHHNTPCGWAIAAGKPRMVEFFFDREAKMQDWYLTDAKDNLKGAYGLTNAPRADYEEILEILNKQQ